MGEMGEPGPLRSSLQCCSSIILFVSCQSTPAANQRPELWSGAHSQPMRGREASLRRPMRGRDWYHQGIVWHTCWSLSHSLRGAIIHHRWSPNTEHKSMQFNLEYSERISFNSREDILHIFHKTNKCQILKSINKLDIWEETLVLNERESSSYLCIF